MRSYLLIVMLLFFARPISAQENATLEQFSVYEVNDQAYLYWIITAGSYCNGIGIERSEDGISYNEIFDIAGVCGGVSFAQAYDFTDTSPLYNSTSYYRLRLGNAGYSESRSILIRNFKGKDYQVLPQPSSSKASIYFNNPKMEILTIRLYNSFGQLQFSVETREDNIDVDVSQLSAGIFLFDIVGSDYKVTGRLMVSR